MRNHQPKPTKQKGRNENNIKDKQGKETHLNEGSSCQNTLNTNSYTSPGINTPPVIAKSLLVTGNNNPGADDDPDDNGNAFNAILFDDSLHRNCSNPDEEEEDEGDLSVEVTLNVDHALTKPSGASNDTSGNALFDPVPVPVDRTTTSNTASTDDDRGDSANGGDTDASNPMLGVCDIDNDNLNLAPFTPLAPDKRNEGGITNTDDDEELPTALENPTQGEGDEEVSFMQDQEKE